MSLSKKTGLARIDVKIQVATNVDDNLCFKVVCGDTQFGSWVPNDAPPVELDKALCTAFISALGDKIHKLRSE